MLTRGSKVDPISNKHLIRFMARCSVMLVAKSGVVVKSVDARGVKLNKMKLMDRTIIGYTHHDMFSLRDHKQIDSCHFRPIPWTSKPDSKLRSK